MNIYVGNLSYDITVEDLRLAFEQFGAVESVNVIKEKFSGQSKDLDLSKCLPKLKDRLLLMA